MKSDCQVSLGWCASNRRSEERGRLWGSGATEPAERRMRWIVAWRRGEAFAFEVGGDGLGPGVEPVCC